MKYSEHRATTNPPPWPRCSSSHVPHLPRDRSSSVKRGSWIIGARPNMFSYARTATMAKCLTAAERPRTTYSTPFSWPGHERTTVPYLIKCDKHCTERAHCTYGRYEWRVLPPKHSHLMIVIVNGGCRVPFPSMETRQIIMAGMSPSRSFRKSAVFSPSPGNAVRCSRYGGRLGCPY